MAWQVFVRVGINNTSGVADNTTNADAVEVTNEIRKALEAAKITKKSKRKTATFRAAVSSKSDIQSVVDGLKKMLDEIAALEGSAKAARLDNVWLLINREDDGGSAAPSTGATEDETEEDD